MALQFPDDKILSNVGPGGRLFTNYNAVNQAGLANAKQAIENQYSPYQQYANAVLTSQQAKYLPFQYQMQALPMMMAAAQGNPAMQAQLQQMMSNPMAVMAGQNKGNEFGIPSPSQQGGGFHPMNALKNLLFGQQGGEMQPQGQPQAPQSNQMSAGEINGTPGPSVNPQGSSASALVPSLSGQVTKGYHAQAFKPGETFVDEQGRIHSAPTGTNVQIAQASQDALNKISGPIERIIRDIGPFVNVGQRAKLTLNKLGNVIGGKEFQKRHGLDPDAPSKYESGLAEIESSAPNIAKALYGTTSEAQTQKIKDVLMPKLGENQKGYENRIRNYFNNIAQEIGSTSGQELSQGFTTENKNMSSPITNEEGQMPYQDEKTIDGITYRSFNGTWRPLKNG